jgi:hypothetical protein
VPAFQAPIHLDLDPEAALRRAARLAGDVRCTCPTPFCRGLDSADWLTCEVGCRACRPRPFTPPIRTRAFARDLGVNPSAEALDGDPS